MCKVDYRCYSAAAVANCVLEEARERGLEVTNLKLQKLVYFAQGFALARLEHPLFREEIQAWTYGPVIPALYERLKHYGAEVVRGMLEAPDSMQGDEEGREVVREVLDVLGGLTATQLVRLSHSGGSPWEAAKRQGKFTRIELWQMALYFTDMLEPSEA